MKPSNRSIAGLIALISVSLAGDFVCRRIASGGDQERCLHAGADAVGRLPTSFGAWRAVESEPLSDRVVEMLQCRGHQSHIYVNDETGERVSLILLVGYAGPILAHTPEVCYSSVDYEIEDKVGPEVVRQDAGATDTFDRVTFRSKSVAAGKQLVYYGWRRFSGSWEAPANPRLDLGGAPMLYKLQLATEDRSVPGRVADEPEGENACRHLLAGLLPELDRLLIAP